MYFSFSNVITNLCEPIEFTIPKTDPNVNYGFWVIMCKCRFATFNKCITLVQDIYVVGNRGGYTCVGAEPTWEISVPSPPFCREL